MTNINEIAYWNQNAYGSAIKIEKRWLRLFLVIMCFITPFTNWLVPFTTKIIRSDLVLRY
ncbi:MAG: hypothetical protein ACOCZQ_00260 [Nanoarchaeota archaeon]